MAGFENDVLVATNVNFNTNLPRPHPGLVTQNGQLLIGGVVAPFLAPGLLTSTDGSITFTVGQNTLSAQVTGGATVLKQLTGNTGTATPTAGSIQIKTANTTVTFVGSASQLLEDFGLTNLMLGSAGGAIAGATNTSSVGNSALGSITSGGSNSALGTSSGANITTGASNTLLGASAGSAYTSSESHNIVIGAGVPGTVAESNVIRIGQSSSTGFQLTGMNSLFFHNFGTDNLFIGIGAGSQTLTGTDSVGIGANCLSAAAYSGVGNMGIGANCLRHVTTGSSNCGMGIATMTTITTSSNNTCVGHNSGNLLNTGSGGNVGIGYQSINQLATGAQVTAIGYQSGTNYTAAETNNICIGYQVTGTAAESNVIRIGNASNASCFITGIDGVNVGSVARVVTEASNQLGTAIITAGAGITVTASANAITIAATGAAFAYTNVNHAASPYTVLTTDEYISVDCSAGTVTLNFPNSPTAKQTWIVKDRTGNASTNNISITTPGGTVTFDGQTTYKITSNYGSIQLLANSTPTYEVY